MGLFRKCAEELIGVEPPRLLHLRQQVRRPLDRAGDQVREQTDEQRAVEQRPGRLELLVVDVDNVGERLKRAEGEVHEGRRPDQDQEAPVPPP
jgi:hypothetical protein